MSTRNAILTFCSLVTGPILCAVAGAAVIFSGGAGAQNPAAFKAKGIGGVTVGASWDTTVKANKLVHVGCEKTAEPFTDRLCSFEYAKPPHIAGKHIAGGTVKLRQGNVVAIGFNAVLSSDFDQESAEMMTALRSEWGTAPVNENSSAMFVHVRPVRANQVELRSPTEIIMQVRKNVALNDFSVTLGENQVINHTELKALK